MRGEAQRLGEMVDKTLATVEWNSGSVLVYTFPIKFESELSLYLDWTRGAVPMTSLTRVPDDVSTIGLVSKSRLVETLDDCNLDDRTFTVASRWDIEAFYSRVESTETLANG